VIGVEDRSVEAAAGGGGHHERVGDQTGAHVVGDRPADHPADEAVRSPVAASTRLSFTRGAVTSTGTGGSHSAGPVMAVADHQAAPGPVGLGRQPAMYWLTSASSAAASIRRAPSRTISSIREPD
jgi:hypothetical protein